MKPGTLVEYCGKVSALVGARLCIVRVSKRTGGLTCEFLHDCGAYKKGSQVNVAKYEIRTVG